MLTPKLLLGALMLGVTVALGIAIARSRKRRGHVPEHDAKGIIQTGKAVSFILVILAFALLFFLNN